LPDDSVFQRKIWDIGLSAEPSRATWRKARRLLKETGVLTAEEGAYSVALAIHARRNQRNTRDKASRLAFQ
jgi:hypothetical protein